MNSIDNQVKQLKKLEASLKLVKFTVSKRKDGIVKVKIGKRIDLITVPSKEWGDHLVAEFEAVTKRQSSYVSEAILHIKNRVEQLQMDLFGKAETNGTERHAVDDKETVGLRGDSVEKTCTAEPDEVQEHSN